MTCKADGELDEAHDQSKTNCSEDARETLAAGPESIKSWWRDGCHSDAQYEGTVLALLPSAIPPWQRGFSGALIALDA